jgi:hypothetical protein
MKDISGMMKLTFCLLTVTLAAQNPPMTGNPYLSRGNPKSPDAKYEWTIRTTNPIRYELVDLAAGKPIAAVNAYYPEANSSNIQYAKAYGVFWSKDGTVVALDELNRRRAGHLYLFILRRGKVREIRGENLIPTPSYADEGRIVVDPGWVSSTEIRVRQALKTKVSEFVSQYYTVDLANPDDPRIQPAR